MAHVLISLGHILNTGIAGSYGNSTFNILIYGFHNGCPILHSCQQCLSVPIISHVHQHLLFSVFFFKYIATLMFVKWHLIVVFILICISLIPNNVMCLLAISVSSLKKCLLKSFKLSYLSFCS